MFHITTQRAIFICHTHQRPCSVCSGRRVINQSLPPRTCCDFKNVLMCFTKINRFHLQWTTNIHIVLCRLALIFLFLQFYWGYFAQKQQGKVLCENLLWNNPINAFGENTSSSGCTNNTGWHVTGGPWNINFSIISSQSGCPFLQVFLLALIKPQQNKSLFLQNYHL